MFLTLVCVVCFVGASVSDAAAPCDTPKQWEGSAWFLDEEGVAKIVRISYDGENKRVRSLSTTLNGPVKRYDRSVQPRD